MTRQHFVAACCVLSMLAQSRAVKRDPLSGTWTGELSPQNASDPISVTMELKFDGKRAVSGTVTGLPRPADVKTGTFDSKTGALKLELGKKDESAVLLILEGTLVKGTAAGHFSGERSGDFKITKKK